MSLGKPNMIRYLYGKKKFLEGIAKGYVSPRFSDLSHYARLENDLMRDKETEKKYFCKKEEANIYINGVAISNEDLATDPQVKIFPRHCYCLCMSSKKDSLELYKRFNANYCLAINVDKLLEYLEKIFGKQCPGFRFFNANVHYYSRYEELISLTPEQAVFYKPDQFSPEAEHRVVIFYPLGIKGFTGPNGENIPLRCKNGSSHIQTQPTSVPTFWADIVEEIFEYEI